MTRELVPIYIEQVIGEPLRTEASFTALNVGLESPHSSTFSAGHNTKASRNNCHSKGVRPRDCATHEIQNRKDQKTKDKGPKEKDTFGAKFFGLQTLPRRTIFFGGVRRYPLRIFFLLRFQTSPSLIARGFRRHLQKSCSPVRSIQKSVFFTGQKREKKTKPEIFPFLSKFHCFVRRISLMHTCRN